MTIEELQHCYRTLGLEPGSSIEIVKRAFRKLVKEWHPDRFHGHSANTWEANERLKEIIPAYESLIAFHSGEATQSRQPTTYRSSPPPPKDAKAQFEEGKRQEELQEYKNAVRWFKQSAEQGYVDAMLALGNLFFEGFDDGIVFKQNYAEAARWYKAAGEKDHAEAQYKFGSIREYGYYKKPNYKDALNWYLKAAKQGHAQAQLAAGLLYAAIRDGIKQDHCSAVFWLRKAAEQGVSEAQFELATIYERGRGGVPKDTASAAMWYQKAAERGHEYAQFEIARCYEEGIGVSRDAHEADRWLRRSDWAGRLRREAEAGNGSSQASIGRMYETGIGIDQDFAEAVKWYRKAAIWGCKSILLSLAKLCATGTGTQQNRVEAFKWLVILNRPSDPNVQSLFRSLTERMDEKSIKRAKRLASNYVPYFMKESLKRRSRR